MAKKTTPPRMPLTKDELARLTIDEYLRLKLSDGESELLREINREREIERQARSARLKIEEEPLVADLQAVGCNVTSAWDMVNDNYKYPEAIPILLKHLLLPYSDAIRDGIARSLAVPEPEVKKAWPMLVAEYRKAPMGQGIVAPGDTKEYRLGVKDGLACALGANVTDETLAEYMSLVRDRSLGESRVLLLYAIRRSKKPLIKQAAKQAIADLEHDPDLSRAIAEWKKKKT